MKLAQPSDTSGHLDQIPTEVGAVRVAEGVVAAQETPEDITARIRKPVEPDVHAAFDVGDVEVARVTPSPFKRWM